MYHPPTPATPPPAPAYSRRRAVFAVFAPQRTRCQCKHGFTFRYSIIIIRRRYVHSQLPGINLESINPYADVLRRYTVTRDIVRGTRTRARLRRVYGRVRRTAASPQGRVVCPSSFRRPRVWHVLNGAFGRDFARDESAAFKNLKTFRTTKFQFLINNSVPIHNIGLITEKPPSSWRYKISYAKTQTNNNDL